MVRSLSSRALEKNDVMLYAISKFGEIPGKKALQKILYFANLRANYFTFRWNKFGPYSEELKYELDTAIMDGMVSVNPTELRMNEGTQYNMQLTRSGRRSLRAAKIDKDTKSGIDLAIKLLNHKNPREMELLASTHYIFNQNNGETDEQAVWNLLTELKPDAHFTLQDVKRAMILLRNVGLVH